MKKLILVALLMVLPIMASAQYGLEQVNVLNGYTLAGTDSVVAKLDLSGIYADGDSLTITLKASSATGTSAIESKYGLIKYNGQAVSWTTLVDAWGTEATDSVKHVDFANRAGIIYIYVKGEATNPSDTVVYLSIAGVKRTVDAKIRGKCVNETDSVTIKF